jgi:hypothetical protein
MNDLIFMGKNGEGEWEYVDCLDADATPEDLQVDRRYMEGEYRFAFGPEWTFKWESST